MELSTSGPTTRVGVNLLAPVALAVVLGLFIWSVGRGRGVRGQ
ncbi:MAG: hypothetical protein ACRDLN_08860 [Solirubrobacteraceae bacterium]